MTWKSQLPGKEKRERKDTAMYNSTIMLCIFDFEWNPIQNFAIITISSCYNFNLSVSLDFMQILNRKKLSRSAIIKTLHNQCRALKSNSFNSNSSKLGIGSLEKQCKAMNQKKCL